VIAFTGKVNCANFPRDNRRTCPSGVGAGVGQRAVELAYDRINRLTSEKIGVPGPTPSSPPTVSLTSYGYDATNNRTSLTKAGVATSYAYGNCNQLTSATSGAESVAFGYDNNGNRTTRSYTLNHVALVDSCAYDSENRLISFVQGRRAGNGAGGLSYQYAYDYRTRRIERHEGTIGTKVVFSGGQSAFEQEEGA